MVAVSVNAPLHIDHVASTICCYDGFTPVIARLIIVNTHSSVVSAWPASADLSCFEIRPGSDRLEDGAFRAGIDASL